MYNWYRGSKVVLLEDMLSDEDIDRSRERGALFLFSLKSDTKNLAKLDHSWGSTVAEFPCSGCSIPNGTDTGPISST